MPGSRTNHIGPKTSVKDRQIRGSLENCCARASDPKIKLRRIWLLRTHSSPKRPHEQQRTGQRAETAWSKRQKRNLCRIFSQRRALCFRRDRFRPTASAHGGWSRHSL